MVLPYIAVGVIGGILGVAFLIYIEEQKNRQQHQYSYNKSNSPRSGSERPRQQAKKNFECEMCAICLNKFEGSSSTLDLKCGHNFHANCLGELICKEHKSCPTCRADIELRA